MLHDDPPSRDETEDLPSLRAELARLRAENERLREWLDLAQDFGRMGVWERDPVTLEGRWDRHVYRYFGYDEGQTPNFEEAVQRVHPDDRLDGVFKASLAAPGLYSHRYRVVRPDGSVAHMHSQWRVVAGADGRAARVLGVMVDDSDVHRLAEAARNAAAQLELALSLASIGLWRHDLASGRIQYDPRAQATLGRTMDPEGVPLETVQAWIHPDDQAEGWQAFEQALAGTQPVDTRTRYLHADGRWRTVLVRRVAQRDAGGRPTAVVGVCLDITEQEQTTRQALELAQRLDGAAEAARVGLWSGPLDDRLPEWSRRMYTLLGRDPAAGPLRLGELLRQYTHADDRERVASEVLSAVRGPVDVPLDLVLRIVRGDGALRWIEVRARQEHDGAGGRRAFGVVLDVTDQHEALEALRAANQRTMLALSSVAMGTWSHDAATGRDVWDEQMFRLRGLAPGGSVPNAEERMALVLPEDRAAVEAASMPGLSSAEPLAYEFRIRRADGEVRTLASRSIALTDEQGHVSQRIGVNWDVTEARLIEHAQREREIALRESRSKSILFSRVSHELRTPLNAILGFTQLMLTADDRLPAEQRRRWLQEIQAGGVNLLALVDGVLALNELTDEAPAITLEPVSLAPVLEGAIGVAQRRDRFDVSGGELFVVSDAMRLRQVLARMVDFAARRSAPHVRVRIEARAEGPEVVIAVTDGGVALTREQSAELFEALAPAAAGTSPDQRFELAIAHAQAARLGARLALARSDAHATTIELRLARADASARAALPQRRTVLYIEDNEVNMMIVRELLAQRADIDFHGAGDGRGGVELARTLRPDLVLVDMHLPDFDGLEVLRRLRADTATAGLRCVALSANAMPDDVRRARAAGFDDYWTKPIDLAAFLREIDRLADSLRPA